MEEQSPEVRLQAWRGWIVSNLAPTAGRVASGAEAALAAGERGLGRFGAAAAACRAMGVASTPVIRAGLLGERAGLEELIGTLPRIQPGNGLTPDGLSELRRVLLERLQEYGDLAGGEATAPRLPATARHSSALPAPVRPMSPVAVAPAAPVRAAVPAGPPFSLQGFLSDHGILLISYVGAFLLIVATLLFEVYGTTGADGLARFGAVLGLTVFFAAAGWYGLRSSRLRLVGRSYVAVAALMTPLDFAAAYSFLVLNRYGITAAVAITLAGASCALLYGALAAGLRSAAYAHMSLVAVAVGWAGFLTAVHAGRWSGPAFGILAIAYVLLGERPGRLARVTSLWKPFSAWYVHAAAAIAITWTLVSVADLNLVAAMRYVAIGFTVVAIAYLLLALLKRSTVAAALAGTAVLGAWTSGIVAFGITDWAGAALAPSTLVVVAVGRGVLGARMVSVFGTLTEAALSVAAGASALWSLELWNQVGARNGATFAAATFAVLALAYVLHTLLTESARSAVLAGVAVLGAWAASVVALGASDWAGAALAPSALVVVAIRKGLLGERLKSAARPSIGVGLHVAAGASALWTSELLTTVVPRDGAFFASATFAFLALAYLLETARSKDQVAGALGLLGAGLAYLAVLYRPELGAWRGVAFVPAIAVFAVLASRPHWFPPIGPALAPAAELLTHVGAPVAIMLAAENAEGWPMTAALAALTLVYAFAALRPERRWLVWLPALGVSATVLQASRPLGFDGAAIALELVVLAYGYLLTSRLAPNREVRIALLAGGASQALATALLPVTPDGVFAVLLAGAAGVGLAIALTERKPIWLSAATPLFTLAWYHAAVALIPPAPVPGPDDLVKVFAPLPALYSMIGLGLRRRFGRAWTLPPHISAALVAAGVVVGGIGVGDYLVLGWALLAYSLLVYLTAILERSALLVAAAALMLAAAIPSLLRSGGGPGWSYPVALVAGCCLFYLLHLPWPEGRQTPDWLLVHRAAGLGGAAVTVLGTYAVTASLNPGDLQFVGALVATVGLAGLLLADARLHNQPLLEYAAALTVVLAIYWIDRFAGATNPQLYVSPIALAITVAAIGAVHDRRLVLDRGLLQTVTAAGLVMLLGTTAVQSISEAVPWTYTGILVVEAAAAVVIGAGIRNRTLVIGGGAAVALASVRALVLIEQQFPLYVVFGGVALVLLVVAAALSMMRDRIASARGSLGKTWQEWD